MFNSKDINEKLKSITYGNLNWVNLNENEPDYHNKIKTFNDTILRFLNTPPKHYINRQCLANKIIQFLLREHGKYEAALPMEHLGTIERLMIPFFNPLRDHLIHSVLTYLLGGYIISKLSLFGQYLHNSTKLTPYSWKLTALLHDVGYPFEITSYFNDIYSKRYGDAKKVQSKIIDQINKTIELNGATDSPKIDLSQPNWLDQLSELSGGICSINIIKDRIDRDGYGLSWGYTNINVLKLFQETKENIGRIGEPVNHGIIGAMIVLKYMDSYFEKHNHCHHWEYGKINGRDYSYKIFVNQIINSCVSIFLHSIPRPTIGEKTISIDKSPLAFLLKLCDEFQDWERLKSKAKQDKFIDNDTIKMDYHKSDKYDIEITDTELRFKAPVNRGFEIKKELTALNNNYFPNIFINDEPLFDTNSQKKQVS